MLVKLCVKALGMLVGGQVKEPLPPKFTRDEIGLGRRFSEPIRNRFRTDFEPISSRFRADSEPIWNRFGTDSEPISNWSQTTGWKGQNCHRDCALAGRSKMLDSGHARVHVTGGKQTLRGRTHGTPASHWFAHMFCSPPRRSNEPMGF